MNLKAGDTLVVGGVEYPIRAVETWTWEGMTAAFWRLARVPASTKRAPAISGGLRGDPTTEILLLHVAPLEPLSAEMRQKVMLQSSYQALQTFCADTGHFYVLVLEAAN